jgi:hypothetical protein
MDAGLRRHDVGYGVGLPKVIMQKWQRFCGSETRENKDLEPMFWFNQNMKGSKRPWLGFTCTAVATFSGGRA